MENEQPAPESHSSTQCDDSMSSSNTMGAKRSLYYSKDNLVSELTLGLYDGSRVAVKCWGNEHAKTKILALHGWLDNAGTWDRLAPLLVGSNRADIRLVCMDFLGHGKSSHKPPIASYLHAERVLEVIAVADALNWKKFILLAHSMGAAVSPLVAGTVPDRIEKVILVDGPPGPVNFRKIPAVDRLHTAVHERPKLINRQKKIYPSFEAALDKYCQNLTYMSRESARCLVQRGTEVVYVSPGVNSGDSETGIMFRHDTRLVGFASSNMVVYSEKQTREFLRRIKCPMLIIMATTNGQVNFFRGEHEQELQWITQRIAVMKDCRLEKVEGHHHIHLDSVNEVFEKVINFIAPLPNQSPVRQKL